MSHVTTSPKPSRIKVVPGETFHLKVAAPALTRIKVSATGVQGAPGINAWGTILGEITNQTDLVAALNSKEDLGTATAAVAAHLADTDPHEQYSTTAEVQALIDGGNFASAIHGHAIADVVGLQPALDSRELIGTADQAIATHLITASHLTTTEVQTLIDAGSFAPLVHGHAIADVTGLRAELDDRDLLGAAASAVAAHIALADPHSQYSTAAEVQALIADHVDDADPHPQYTSTAELNAAIDSIPPAPVQSVFGRSGDVVAQSGDYSSGQITEGSNLYFTIERSRNSLSATGPLDYNPTTGIFSLPIASSTQNGYLSNSDWVVFNSKQPALGYTPENAANKAGAGGYASLDSGALVPTAQIGTNAADSTKFLRGDRTWATPVSYPLFDGVNWTFSQSSRPTARPNNSALVTGDRWIAPTADYYYDGNIWLSRKRPGTGPRVMRSVDMASIVTGSITSTTVNTGVRRFSWSAGATGTAIAYTNHWGQGGAAPFGLTTGGINLSNPVTIFLRARLDNMAAFRCYWGVVDTVVTDLATKGFGFKINADYSISLQIYGNSGLTSQPATSAHQGGLRSYLMAWDGTSKLVLYDLTGGTTIGSATADLSGVVNNAKLALSTESVGGSAGFVDLHYLEVEGN